MASRSKHWESVRTLEDALALLAQIDDRRKVVREQLWREGDLQTAFAEITAMKPELARLKATLSSRWHELFEIARQEDANERNQGADQHPV